MARRSFSRINPYARYIPFGLFAGQISGAMLLVLALILILMSSLRPGLFETPRRMTMDGLSTPLTILSVPFKLLDGFLANLFFLTQVRAEAENLREENRRLQDWYNVAQLLKAENQSLRSLLKVRINQSLSNVTVQVIGDTSGPYGQIIVIDGGDNERLTKGDAVLGGEGLIGRVMQVNAATSTVLLMTDISSRIPVRIEGSNVQGILTGSGGQDLILTRLPEGSRLNEDERIVTSGIGGVFPPDLPVGMVRIQKNGRVNVAPFADFGRLLYVRVVRMRYDMKADLRMPETRGNSILIAPVMSPAPAPVPLSVSVPAPVSGLKELKEDLPAPVSKTADPKITGGHP